MPPKKKKIDSRKLDKVRALDRFFANRGNVFSVIDGWIRRILYSKKRGRRIDNNIKKFKIKERYLTILYNSDGNRTTDRTLVFDSETAAIFFFEGLNRRFQGAPQAHSRGIAAHTKN